MSRALSRLLAAFLLAGVAGAAYAQAEPQGRYDPELDRFVTAPDGEAPAEGEAPDGEAPDGEAEAEAGEAGSEEAALADEAAPAAEGPYPPLWLVRDQDTEIHILGAVHLLEADIGWRTPLIEQAIADAWLIAFETDTRPQSNGEAAGVYQVYGRLDGEGETLRGLMSEEGVKVLEEQAQAFGYSAEKLDALAPWNALVRFAGGYLEANGAQPYADVERNLETTVLLARSELEPFYFSTLTEQLRSYATMDQALQVAALEASLEDMKAHPDKPQKIAAAWLQGNVEALDTLINDGLDDNPELKAALYDSRVDVLAQEIGSLLEGPGKTFVTLPLGQLIGKHGLLARLERAGLSVERIGEPAAAEAAGGEEAEPEASEAEASEAGTEVEDDGQAVEDEGNSEAEQASGED